MPARIAMLGFVFVLLGGCVASRDEQLAQDNVHLRAELEASKEQVLALTADRDRLSRQLARAYAEATRLKGNTAYLRSSNVELSSAVNRLASEDWNTVVPDVQRTYSDAEMAANDLDDHVSRVVRALETR